MTKRRWLALITVLCTAALGALLLIQVTANCDALIHYRGFRVSDLKDFFLWMCLFAPAVFSLGTFGYRKLWSSWSFLGTTLGTIVFFMLLTIMAFPLQYGRLLGGGQERQLKESICMKSASDGMFTTSKGLAAEEYNILLAMNPMLPALPVPADSIRVQYYSDGFLPDYSVEVRCAVEREQTVGYPPYHELHHDGPTGWMLDTTRLHPRVSWLVYADGDS